MPPRSDWWTSPPKTANAEPTGDRSKQTATRDKQKLFNCPDDATPHANPRPHQPPALPDPAPGTPRTPQTRPNEPKRSEKNNLPRPLRPLNNQLLPILPHSAINKIPIPNQPPKRLSQSNPLTLNHVLESTDSIRRNGNIDPLRFCLRGVWLPSGLGPCALCRHGHIQLREVRAFGLSVCVVLVRMQHASYT